MEFSSGFKKNQNAKLTFGHKWNMENFSKLVGFFWKFQVD